MIDAPQMAVLLRPRGPVDQWPSFGKDNAPTDVLVVDRRQGRRLQAAGPARYGLWLVPGRLKAAPPASPTDVCLRVIPMDGANRGGGGAGCMQRELFGRDPSLVATITAGGRGSEAYAPRQAIVAGTVPDGVRKVQLQLRGGGALTQRVRDNAFLFDTRRIVKGLRYRVSGRVIVRPLDLCQACS